MIAIFWFSDNKLAYIFAGAMIVTIIVAVLAGAAIANIPQKIKN